MTILSAWILLQPLTVCWMNRGALSGLRVDWLTASMPSLMAWQGVERYAALVGLDTSWRMYSNLPHYSWHFVLKAEYAGGPVVVLPLPLQSPRTFWQRAFFDFKEPEFHHYVAWNPAAKQAYARYLCRTYPRYQEHPIQAIIWENEWYYHLLPLEAARRGTHRDTLHRDVLNRYTCPSAVEEHI